jgi:hypothetical protein
LTPADQVKNIQVFGLLPGDPAKDLSASIGSKSVSISRSRWGSIILGWPTGLVLREDEDIPIGISVRRTAGPFGLFHKTITINDRIRVAIAKPFHCTLEEYTQNPDYIVEVSASKPFSDEATTQQGAGKASVITEITADKLLVATVPNWQDYDLNSVSILKTGESFSYHGGCWDKGPTGKLDPCNSTCVAYELYAPTMNDHVVTVWTDTRLPGH